MGTTMKELHYTFEYREGKYYVVIHKPSGAVMALTGIRMYARMVIEALNQWDKTGQRIPEKEG